MRPLMADKMFVREITNGARRSAFELRKMREGPNPQHWVGSGQFSAGSKGARLVHKCWEDALILSPFWVTV